MGNFTPLRLLPVLPLLVVLTACTGCFYVPLARSAVDKESVDPPTLIGDADSKKPIQPNLATKQQVVKLIGEPDRVSGDGRVIGYSRQYKGGAWVAPLCLYGWRQRVDEAYRLEFDSQDILIRHRSLEAVANDGLLCAGYGPAQEVRNFLDPIGPEPPMVPPIAPPISGQPYPPQVMPPHPPARSPYWNSAPDGRWYETR